MISYSQQDPQFSQYMFNMAAFNPGYTGSHDKICISGVNRQQWVGFDGAPSYSFFNANGHQDHLDSAVVVGLSILSDNLAFNQDLAISGAYAARLSIGPGTLGIGVNIGLYNKALDATWYIPDGIDDMVGPDQDPSIPNESESTIAFDMGFGLFYNTENLYFGISTTHLNQPTIKYEQASPFWPALLCCSRLQVPALQSLFEIMPSAIIKSDGKTHSFDVSGLLRYNKRFWGGVSYRPGDAVSGIIGFELFNGLRVGYSYDFTTSSIGKYSDGSHEFTLGYCFSLSTDKTPQKYRSIRFL